MAYTTISSTAIQVGKPVTADLWSTVKDDLDDHETRILSVEAATNKIVVFNFPVLNATSSATFTGLTYWRAPSAFTLTDAKIIIYEKGSLTGSIEFDVKTNSSVDNTGMTSVFTTKPKLVLASVSDYAESTNAVFDATGQAIAAGEWLRLDMTILPGGGVCGKFNVYLIGEP